MDDMPGMHGSGGMWSMTGPMWMPDLAPSWARLFAFHLQPVPIVPFLGLLGFIGYLLAVALVRANGQHWPLGRTISWLTGLVVLEVMTTTGIEAYGMMLFSVHMAQHMVLAMVVPILLALGSPYRLALASAPPGPGGQAFTRALERIARSRAAVFLLSVPVRWCLFLASLYGIYFTPLFGDLMHTVWGHNVMLLHFLATGSLFFGPLVAESQVGRGAPRRLAETFASTPLHAVFGLSIMLSTGPILRFFDTPDPAWSVDPLSDQTLAGSIAWATSEGATVLVMAILVARWIRAGPPADPSSPRRAVVPERDLLVESRADHTVAPL